MTSVNPKSLAKNPVAYADRNPAGAALLTFAALAALAYARKRKMPTTGTLMQLAAYAAVFVLVANVAPDFVAWVVLAAILAAVVMGQENPLTRFIDQGTSRAVRLVA